MSIIYRPNHTIANGHYEFIRLIGEGGTGVVYQCVEQPLNKYVAIKVLRQELVEDKKQIDLFKHEAKLAAQLHHAHIVDIYEVNREKSLGKEIHYLVMEYLPGGSLTTKLQSGINIKQSLDWMKQLLKAIGYAHEQGIVHQDVKSANVFLSEDGQVKIGDFGLARLTKAAYSGSFQDEMNEEQIKVFAQKMGTPAYMSPELCYGELQDERSDIYSLGVLFFEMLTGKVPFEALGMIELARQHISKPVPAMSRLNPEIPPILDDMVKRMMAKDKAARFQSTEEILSILEYLTVTL